MHHRGCWRVKPASNWGNAPGPACHDALYRISAWPASAWSAGGPGGSGGRVGYGSFLLMAMTTSRRFYMDAARRVTRDLIVNNPVTPDVFNEYEAVQGWPLVTALYNGIEQALKMLLLIPSDTRFTLERLAREYGHDLERLYGELAVGDREHIDLHYREHRSLHDYIPKDLATAEQFIAHINRSSSQQTTGLVSWRYILIEGPEQVPPMSLWTMHEIWDAVCCRIRKASGKNDCFRLRKRLARQHWSIATGRALRYDEQLDDLNRWAASRGGDLVAAWIDLLVKVSHDAIDQVQAPPRLRSDLVDKARIALGQLSESADPDDMHLFRRIQGTRALVWDSSNGGFQ